MSERQVWKEPIGVVGVIVPWNFPMEITLNKLGPILAMGNTCVLKPAPDTPWTATRLGRLIAEQTDIPPGVVNIVTSSDHLVGEVITTSPVVDMVAFTGSTATGRRIMEAAAATLKPMFLELGGKSVNLVLDDADLARPPAVRGRSPACTAGRAAPSPPGCWCPGPGTTRPSRSSTAAFAGLELRRPDRPGEHPGPPGLEAQQDRVLGYIEKGKEEGARLVPGGGVPTHLEKGFYVEPTLFADVDNPTTIAQEEIFGPVLVVIPLRRTTTTPSGSPTTRSTACPARSRPATSTGPRRWPAASAPARSASTAASGTAPTPRSAATRARASAASAASRASRSSPRRRRWAGRPVEPQSISSI